MRTPSLPLVTLFWLAAALSGCGTVSAERMAPASAAGLTADMATSRAAMEEAPAPSALAQAPSPSLSGSPAGSVVGSSGRASGPSARTDGGARSNAAEGPAAMLIYTASVGMTTDEDQVSATIDAIIDAAYALGGYVANRTNSTVMVRIPSAQFRQGLRQVEQLGEVTGRSVSTEDVSEQFHDLEVRLQNLRALRQRLEQFFSRANTIQEALQVQAELERVAREIDQIEGRMRFLSSRAAFSMVTVTVAARPRPLPAQVLTPPPPPPPPAPIRRIVEVPIDWLGRIGVGRLLDLSNP